MKDIAPSSRRARSSIEIAAVLRSQAMKLLHEGVLGPGLGRSRYVRLIVPIGDMPELTSLVAKIAKTRKAEGDLVVVQQNDESMLRDDDKFSRGQRALLLPRSGKLSAAVIERFIALHEARGRQNLVVAVFPTLNIMQKTLSDWPRMMHENFQSEPLIWPSLQDRDKDLPIILERVCEQVQTVDGSTSAKLTNQAKQNLIQHATSVEDLINVIRGAFDVMLLQGHLNISLLHLNIWRDPNRRRAIFAARDLSAG